MITVKKDKYLRYFSEKTKMTAAEIAEQIGLSEDDAGRYFSEVFTPEQRAALLESLMGRVPTSYERQIFPLLLALGSEDCPECGMLLEVVEWEGYERQSDYDSPFERVTTYQRMRCRHCGAEVEEGEMNNGI
jgi:hypothetical protein